MKYTLYHKFDAKHAKNLGEESVSDNIQAVIELGKNAYDGDATECTITFVGFKDKIQGFIVTKIIIADNGVGMSFYDIAERWMNIGTQHKIKKTDSPITKRRVVGQKGIGHFACQKLGERVTIISNPMRYGGREHLDHIDKTLTLTQDWSKYKAGLDFSKVPNEITITDRKDEDSRGVTIEISELKQRWKIEDIERIRATLGLLLLPPSLLKNKKQHDFTIVLDAKQLGIEDTAVSNDVMKYAPYKLSGRLRGKKLYWEISKRVNGFERKVIATESNQIGKEFTNNKCGDLDVEFYHFPKGPKYWERGKDGLGALPSGPFKGRDILKAVRENSGIKIYKDDVRIMPYGEPGNDWMNLEKTAASRGGGRIRNTAILGFVILYSKTNPKIEETTTRQQVISNEAFRSLAGDPHNKQITENSIMITLLRKLEHNWGRVQDKTNEVKKNRSALAQIKLKQAKNEITKLPDDLITADIKKEIISHLTSASSDITNLQREYDDDVENYASLEELYRSLASFAISVLAFQHETRDPVRKIGNAIRDLRTAHLTDDEMKDTIDYAWNEFENLNSWRTYVKSFANLISGAKNVKNLHSKISFSDIITNITTNQQAAFIVKRHHGKEPNEAIKISFEPIGDEKNWNIYANPIHFEGIFTNMISNSIKALKSVKREQYEIKIRMSIDTSYLNMEFSDNGVGILEDDKDEIWREFWTTYTDPNYKGMGLGLPITKEIVEVDYGGEIKLIESTSERDKPGEGHTTFLIRIPLKELK